MNKLPVEVAVLGSCTSRDNFNSRFNPDYKRFYRCPLVQNQSSIISLMSEPVEMTGELTGDMSEYDRWNVQTDLNKEFLRLVVELQPTYLIVDFFGDVHFGCLRLDDGRYITNNRWKLWRTDFYKSMKESGRLTPVRFQTDQDAYFALWKEAFDRLVAYLDEHLPDTRLVLHRGFNTNKVVVPGRDNPMVLTKYKKLNKLDVPLANELWRRLDDYAAEVTDCDVIDLTTAGYTSFADHPWGAFYVHYTMDYYHRFLAELHKIHLRHEVDPDLVAMVEDIESASAERSSLLAEASARTVARQKSRIAEQAAELEQLRSPSVVQVLRRRAKGLGARARVNEKAAGRST